MFVALASAFFIQAVVPASMPSASDTAGRLEVPAGVTRATTAPEDSGAQRPHAVQLSDWYYRRLTIHRIGSYAELPLFGAEYILGHKLLYGQNIPSYVKPTHLAVAEGLGALFTINTVTGVWNLLDAWPPPEKRVLVLTHTALMLSADAGFVITGERGSQANHNLGANGIAHRNAALTSIGIATAGTAIMWLWNK